MIYQLSIVWFKVWLTVGKSLGLATDTTMKKIVQTQQQQQQKTNKVRAKHEPCSANGTRC